VTNLYGTNDSLRHDVPDNRFTLSERVSLILNPMIQNRLLHLQIMCLLSLWIRHVSYTMVI